MKSALSPSWPGYTIMLTPELVSVVIVAHNNWPELELAVQSALQQTHPPFEVIVVDNDSIDGTEEHVGTLFRERVRYIRQENRLDSGGYNTGIRAARGEFIQLLDGDDCLAPNKIEKQLAVMRADPSVDIAYTDARYFLGGVGVASWSERELTDWPDVLSALCVGGGNIGLTIASLFRRSLFDRVGLFDEEIYGADYEFWFRAAALGARFRYAPGTLLFYRQWPGQMSRSRSRMHVRAEQTFEKALTLVQDESLRYPLQYHLARTRLWHAMDPTFGLSKSQATQKLAAARQISSAAIPLPLFLLARVAISLPRGRRAFSSSWVRAAARKLATLRQKSPAGRLDA
jgi:GT2 family glycosyltransferase